MNLVRNLYEARRSLGKMYHGYIVEDLHLVDNCALLVLFQVFFKLVIVILYLIVFLAKNSIDKSNITFHSLIFIS